jgi:hypothetical protein
VLSFYVHARRKPSGKNCLNNKIMVAKKSKAVVFHKLRCAAIVHIKAVRGKAAMAAQKTLLRKLKITENNKWKLNCSCGKSQRKTAIY